MKIKDLIGILDKAGDELPVELDLMNGEVYVRVKGKTGCVEPVAAFIDEDGFLQIIVPETWRPQ